MRTPTLVKHIYSGTTCTRHTTYRSYELYSTKLTVQQTVRRPRTCTLVTHIHVPVHLQLRQSRTRTPTLVQHIYTEACIRLLSYTSIKLFRQYGSHLHAICLPQQPSPWTLFRGYCRMYFVISFVYVSINTMNRLTPL